MARIVVIEDDITLASMVKTFLEHESYEVHEIHDGIEAQAYVLSTPVDLIILDWDLPGLSGLEILKDYRTFGGKCPVLMLTGHGSIQDKETGFEEGADDYLTKPFNIKELSVRIKGLLRRSKVTVGNVVTIGDIIVDLDTSKVMKSGRNVTLLPREYQLLSYLIKNRKDEAKPDELLSSVWTADAEMTTETVETVVRRLSRKLDPDGRILRISSIISNPAASGARITGGVAGEEDDIDAIDPMIGRLLESKYEIIKGIGGGATGKVYKAKHLTMNMNVAVKVLAPQLSTQPELVRRFEREARAAAQVKHKNIIIVYDLGITEESQPYMVMEYLAGNSLAEMLERNGKLSLPDALEITSQICRGIGKAHEEGVVHRDLKPGNIMLLAERALTVSVKIVDFGLAKSFRADDTAPNLTQHGSIIGTPSYMSPEQCRSETTDHRCDIYAIGCMLYEMLTGKVPFYSANLIETFMRHANEPPPPLVLEGVEPRISNRMQYIVHGCMQKEKERRYQSAARVQHDLSEVASVLGQPVSP